MTFLMPAVLLVGAVGTLAAIALHLLSVRRPPAMLLPTARFINPRDVRAVSRSTRPSDLLLLLLRVLALWCAAVALSGPRWTSGARTTGHVIVADASLRRDSARIASRAGVASAPVRFAWSDSSSGMRAELGAAWPLAWRAANAMMRDEAALDSVALHIVVPRSSESFDGWAAWRHSWPGKVDVEAMSAANATSATTATSATSETSTRSVAATEDSAGRQAPTGDVAARATVTVIGGATDDVVRVAFDVHVPRAGGSVSRAPAAPATPQGTTEGVSGTGSGSRARTIRVLRDAAGASEGDAVSGRDRATSGTGDDAGSVTVYWPVNGVPRGWKAMHDTIGGVIAGNDAVVAPWVRSAAPRDSAASSRTRAIAWWSDGVPAAIERPSASGTGCTREVGIAVPNGSDVLLSPSAKSLIAALAAPCGRTTMPVPRSVIDDSGNSTSLASASALRTRLAVRDAVAPRWLPAALLASAIALLLVESAVRRAGDDAGGAA